MSLVNSSMCVPIDLKIGRSTYQKYQVPMMYGVPFLCYMTSNKTYDFCEFSKFITVYRLISKLVHTLIRPIVCILQKCIDKNNMTYVSLATKYPIIKHKAFF